MKTDRWYKRVLFLLYFVIWTTGLCSIIIPALYYIVWGKNYMDIPRFWMDEKW